MADRQQLTVQQQRMIVGGVAALFLVVIIIAKFMANRQAGEITDNSLAHFRETHPTHLERKVPAPAPQSIGPINRAPIGASYAQYTSDAGNLGAWIAGPKTKGKHPAILWAHGGYSVGPTDFEIVRPFIDAGFVVMIPAWRGENRNPGHFEMCYGEVDDAKAALNYLRALPHVDRSSVYAAGHSVGATLILLLAEVSSDLKKVAVCGAYPNMCEGGPYDGAPFSRTDTTELASRSPGEHVPDLSCPALLIYSSDEKQFIAQAQKMKDAAEKAGKTITIKTIPCTDHYQAVVPAVRMMIDYFSTN
jgi:dipeptidyl aminopeptidase/acylaminoacyl peptidase